ncbi:MAG: hypothetical protein ACTH1E_02980, partial [Brevibacterium yomogidense]
ATANRADVAHSIASGVRIYPELRPAVIEGEAHIRPRRCGPNDLARTIWPPAIQPERFCPRGIE